MRQFWAKLKLASAASLRTAIRSLRSSLTLAADAAKLLHRRLLLRDRGGHQNGHREQGEHSHDVPSMERGCLEGTLQKNQF